jgi:hypothetical protein
MWSLPHNKIYRKISTFRYRVSENYVVFKKEINILFPKREDNSPLWKRGCPLPISSPFVKGLSLTHKSENPCPIRNNSE